MLSNKPAVFAALITSLILQLLYCGIATNAQPIPTRNILAVNRSAYVVGERTVYVIRGAAPDSIIYWSSWKDGVPTNEVDTNYGHRTDAFGNWTATVGPWTEDLIGLWKKQAKIGGNSYVVKFQVQPRPLPDFPDKAGQYYWTPPKNSPITLDYAADRISQLGGRAMHLAFFTGCNPMLTLIERAQMDDAMRAFANPNIKSYVLTTYGTAGCGFAGKTLFDPKLYPSIAPSIEQEYKEFTLHLYRTYLGSGKRFVISTWEGDNVLHCGSAVYYANNVRIAPDADGIPRDPYGSPMPIDPNDPAGRSIPFRNYCDALYPQIGIADANEAHEGYRHWLDARQRGVRQGREEAAALGLFGVEVYHAPEFNVIDLLEHPKGDDGQPLYENGRPVRFKSVLRDILPNLDNGFDFVSYSAYETANLKSKNESTESLQKRVTRDLNSIRRILGTRNIIIGEFGYERYSSINPSGLADEEVIRRTEEVIDAALDWGVAAIFTWQMFDDHWGAFDSQGNLLPLGHYFRQRYTR